MKIFIGSCIQIYLRWAAQNNFLNFVLLLYVFVSTVLYLHHKVMVFDEAWFTCCFSNKGFTNHLAYGHFYWLFMDLVDNTFILRLFALLAMLSIPVFIYKIGYEKLNANQSRCNLTLLLWLTYPSAWWYGKLVAPELYCLALGLWGLYLAFPPTQSKKVKFIGISMMGVAVGVKLSFIVFPFFYYTYSFLVLFEKNKLRSNFIATLFQFIWKEEKLGIFLIVGFLIGSPSLLFKPDLYFENLFQFSNSGINYGAISNLYNLHLGKFWETVVLPSITGFSLSILSSIYFFICCFIYRLANKKLFFSFLLTFVFFIILLLKTPTYFPWYAYPIILLTLMLCLTIKLPKRHFVIIILLNVLANSPVIFTQVAVKVTQISVHYQDKDIRHYIESHREKFINKYKEIEQYISFRPETGSGIIALNSYLLGKKRFTQPTFFAVHKIMMVNYANTDNVYHFIPELFNENRIYRFKQAVQAANEYCEVQYLGSYEDIHVFTVVPHSYLQ